jgi:hypothetical protein
MPIMQSLCRSLGNGWWPNGLPLAYSNDGVHPTKRAMSDGTTAWESNRVYPHKTIVQNPIKQNPITSTRIGFYKMFYYFKTVNTILESAYTRCVCFFKIFRFRIKDILQSLRIQVDQGNQVLWIWIWFCALSWRYASHPAAWYSPAVSHWPQGSGLTKLFLKRPLLTLYTIIW